tara:strand:+ start:112 stop:330 length:219 start_codon:yes stop_codon:yes gene_type:complete
MSEETFYKIFKNYFELKKNLVIKKNTKLKNILEFDSLNQLKFITFMDEFGLSNSKRDFNSYKDIKSLIKNLK